MSDSKNTYNSAQKILAEFIGTAFLLMAIVGSGIMGTNLSPDNLGVTLLAHAVAIGTALIVLITMFGPISGGHFNPAVTLFMMLRKTMCPTGGVFYIVAQVAGAIGGVMLAHIMFGQQIMQLSDTLRTGTGQWIAELVATFGLLTTIIAVSRFNPERTAPMVGLYIISALWFTASTCFANPAVTIARLFTDTFAGIAPQDVWPFVIMQILAIPVAWLFERVCLTPAKSA